MNENLNKIFFNLIISLAKIYSPAPAAVIHPVTMAALKTNVLNALGLSPRAGIRR